MPKARQHELHFWGRQELFTRDPGCNILLERQPLFATAFTTPAAANAPAAGTGENPWQGHPAGEQQAQQGNQQQQHQQQEQRPDVQTAAALQQKLAKCPHFKALTAAVLFGSWWNSQTAAALDHAEGRAAVLQLLKICLGDEAADIVGAQTW